MAEQAWEGTTFGTGFMHRWLIKALRHTDVRLWYTFAAVCIIPSASSSPQLLTISSAIFAIAIIMEV